LRCLPRPQDGHSPARALLRMVPKDVSTEEPGREILLDEMQG
jgi:hypothetical protein